MILSEHGDSKLFLCASANWRCVVEASSYDQAASKSVQQMIDEYGMSFSIGAVTSVAELSFKKNNSILIFSPKILADIGMHGLATNLLNTIDKDTNDED